MHVDAEALRSELVRIRRIYEREAPSYDAAMRVFDRLLFAGGREWVCSLATGDVLELGIGTGLNLPLYPADVRLTGVDISPAMLAIARRRADELGRAVDLREADAAELPFPDQSFDTIVSTLVLCSVPDDRRVVAEARRVLRPGGRSLLLEHVRSPLLPIRLLQRALDPLTVRLQGDHYVREPLDHLAAMGFEVDALERSKLGIVERVMARRADPGGDPRS